MPTEDFLDAFDHMQSECRRICCEKNLGVKECEPFVVETEDGEMEAMVIPVCGGKPIFCPSDDESVKLPDTLLG